MPAGSAVEQSAGLVSASFTEPRFSCDGQVTTEGAERGGGLLTRAWWNDAKAVLSFHGHVPLICDFKMVLEI